jgi:hypothetical protein
VLAVAGHVPHLPSFQLPDKVIAVLLIPLTSIDTILRGITFQSFRVFYERSLFGLRWKRGECYIHGHPNSFAPKAFGAQQASFDCPDASGIAEG